MKVKVFLSAIQKKIGLFHPSNSFQLIYPKRMKERWFKVLLYKKEDRTLSHSPLDSTIFPLWSQVPKLCDFFWKN